MINEKKVIGIFSSQKFDLRFGLSACWLRLILRLFLEAV